MKRFAGLPALCCLGLVLAMVTAAPARAQLSCSEPDQFALVRQVQSACDTAQFAAAKLSGQPPPVHPDTEKTLAELSVRIHTCIAYLETFEVSDFVGAETRACSHVWMQGKHLTGRDYVAHYVLPNFYFHMVTAYAILRHNGVDVGKLDYLGELPMVG